MKEKRLTIRHDVSPEDIGSFLDFLYRRIVEPRRVSLEKVELKYQGGDGALRFSLGRPWDSEVEVLIRDIIVDIRVRPRSPMGEAYASYLLDSIATGVAEYNGMFGKATLYLVFTDKMDFRGMRGFRVKEKIVSRMFSGTLTYLIASFMVIALLLIFFGDIAPLLLVGIHFSLLLASDRLLLRISEWRINEDNRHVHILEIKTDRKNYGKIIDRVLPRVVDVKREIYARALAGRESIDLEEAMRVLEEQGLPRESLSVRCKSIDLYEMVEDIAARYGIRTPPKVGILNTIVPNAAAIGVDPRASSLLVTSGLIALLNRDELEGVIAHELSHVRNRDPLILSFIAAGEYLSRIYVLYPALLPLWEAFPALALAYVGVALFAILFLAKFAEARADLEAAEIVGDPEKLASALRKLGWRRIILESKGRGRAWFRIDPHPPMYFRVKRLESMGKNMARRSHSYLSSALECLSEMFRALSSF